MQYIVRTLGCKANLYDSQLIEAELQRRGWTPLVGASDSPVVCIVNSCTVTDEADRQSRKLASRLSREHPGSRVVVTGCSAEVDPERLAASQGIHYVIGNRDKPKLVDLILEQMSKPLPSHGEVLGRVEGYSEISSRHPEDREWMEPSQAFETPPVGLSTRAFLKIQEGCNSFCTYCIIPYGRGPSRSLRPREIIEQVKSLVAQGVREVIITGTNIGDYGTDWDAQPQITELLKMILSETSLERLRVSSLDPTEISVEMFALMKSEPRFCPHFHVSLQSASDRVLRLMKRRYGVSQIESCLLAIAALGDVFVGMDVIVGFPGETLEEFEKTREVLARLPWSRLHVFPYSEREGTPATRLGEVVPKAERARRAKILQEMSLARLQATYTKFSGSTLGGILLEKTRPPVGHSGEWLAGYTPQYLKVLVPLTGAAQRNGIVDAQVGEPYLDTAGGDAYFIAQA